MGGVVCESFTAAPFFYGFLPSKSAQKKKNLEIF